METRSLFNQIQYRTGLRIVPDLHTQANPVTFLMFLMTFIECKHNFRYFTTLYGKIRKANRPRILLCTLPRSGTNYLINLYVSAVSISEGASGKPSYNPTYDSWDYELDLRGYSTTLRNLLYAAKMKQNKCKYTDRGYTLHPLALFFGHHPIQKADLVDIDHTRPVFTLRKIEETCRSWHFHTHAEPEEWRASAKIGMDKWHLISRRAKWIIRYYNYWGDFTKGKAFGKDFLYVKYEQLVRHTMECMRRLFDFYDIPMNDGTLAKAVELNSYENTKKYIPATNSDKTRRISMFAKPEFDDEVLERLNDMKKQHLNHDFGYP